MMMKKNSYLEESSVCSGKYVSADSNNMSIDLGNRCHAVSNCSDSGAAVAK